MIDKYRHCGCCGYPFKQTGWPRTCTYCNETTYRNPLPVAVALVPVTDQRGLLVVRRAVTGDPGHGGLALPGGFIDYADASWQHAAAREVWEETGIRVAAEGFRAFDVISAPDKTLLLFAVGPGITSADLASFRPTHETSEVAVITGPVELSFALHTRVARAYFERLARGEAP